MHLRVSVSVSQFNEQHARTLNITQRDVSFNIIHDRIAPK